MAAFVILRHPVTILVTDLTNLDNLTHDLLILNFLILIMTLWYYIVCFSSQALHEPLVRMMKKELFHDFQTFFIVFDHASACARMRLLVEIHNTYFTSFASFNISYSVSDL